MGKALSGTQSAPPELRKSETAWLGWELHGNTAKLMTRETLSDEVERLTDDSTLWSIASRQRMSFAERISNSAFPIHSRR